MSQDDLQEMPDRLDVGVVEGVVGVVHVHPEAHPLGHALPVADVAHDRLAAAPGELLDPHLALDAGLVEDPELLLDLVLDGQAVGVPARPARAVVAAHGLVAGKHVLEGAGEHVVEPRPAVRGRRTFVPDVEGPAFGLALAGLEHLPGAPPLEDLFLDPHTVVAAVDFAKAHDAPPGGGDRGPDVSPSSCPGRRSLLVAGRTPRGEGRWDVRAGSVHSEARRPRRTYPRRAGIAGRRMGSFHSVRASADADLPRTGRDSTRIGRQARKRSKTSIPPS